MDITANQLKNMKAKQLRRIIREAIDEILNEGEAENKAAEAAAKQNQQAQQQAADAAEKAAQAAITAAKAKKTAVAADKNPGLMEENEIEEMANVGKLFQLAPDADISTLTGKKSRIAAAMQDAGEPISQANVAKALGYTKVTSKGETVGHQNPIDKDFREMGTAGIIVPAGTQIAQRFNRPALPPGEENDEETGPKATDAEDLFIGGADPLSMYFDGEPNADGSEDFNAEEEPTPDEVEPAGEPTSTGGMSDEDFAAWDKYDTLKTRLNGVKSNLNKMKRGKGKGGVAGDIGDASSNEEERLRDLKKSLEDRINALVAGSTYLQKKVEKETGKAYEPIATVEPEEEEDTIDEAFDFEYQKRKLQFYAGIIK